ncbi:histone deacetylase [Telmatocola sphagniphila]|uniref:Histone deacetylase n=1 Tax=Telmatocola sphagniphila TaxID=1123043 RepID=A0A8E6B5W1_9BACT|nr:histone deacetylase [Telmatocola sphagniphila]QVL32730.1 histone deacetylase [Telmatocola sphagniphila]
MAKVVYSRHYNLGFWGFERFHAFDGKKYGRAWKELSTAFGKRLSEFHIEVDRPATFAELELVHSSDYLSSLYNSKVVAAALEMPPFRHIPNWVLRWKIMSPMLWACRGTVIAAKAALADGLAINLSGGYHHAKPNRSEGFCLFSDIAMAVKQLRHEGVLEDESIIAYVDLDAHQGNGVCYQFLNDPHFRILDIYNKQNYPFFDDTATDRIDCDLSVRSRCVGSKYLEILRTNLPKFLDDSAKSRLPSLGIYNAGTDVYFKDRFGGLRLHSQDILQRDLYVVEQFRIRGIPVVMLPSGGYSRESYRLLADSVTELLQRY